MAIYIGVNGKAREVKNVYIGVNGKARKIKAGFIGVNGKARKFFDSKYSVNYVLQNLTATYMTLHEYFCGTENGVWKVYVNSSATQGSDTSRIIMYISIKGDSMAGQTLKMSYKRDPAWRQNKDDVYLEFITKENTQISNTYLSYTTYKTYSVTIPSNAYEIRIGISQGTNGDNITTTLLINSLSIGSDVVL